MDATLDDFQKILEDGLVKVCSMSGFALNGIMTSPDLDEKWDSMLKEYVADAINNFNDYPQAALGFASYLGMAVANQWDASWTENKDNTYRSYYGNRGYDNMDDHIVQDILRLSPLQADKLSRTMLNCTQATLDLLRHEHIELQTKNGFYVLVRCYTAMFRLGVSIELTRLGYKKQIVPNASVGC
ncbi:MAG: hypothetical protein MJY76_04770 [Bacteroidales bacterium]|nr:hypothetical protein [Bacteroidales bacterium]